MKRLVNRLFFYLRLYVCFVRFSIQDILVYRLNGLLFGVAPIVWMGTVLIFIATIFSKVKSLGGWTLWEVIFLTSIHELIFIFTWTTFVANLTSFTNEIRTGRLDLVLTKPVNPRFLISFRSFDFSVIGSFINALLIFVFSFTRAVEGIVFYKLIGFLILLIMAYWIVYYIYFFFACVSLFFASSRYLMDWIGELTDFDRYPAEIYSSWLRVLLLFFLPILFFAYVPTAYILGKVGEEYIIGGLFVLVALHLITTAIWRRGLRYYQSASS